MKDLETKKNVLKEIMDLMDSREGDRLKGLKPKPAAAVVEIEAEPKDEALENDSAKPEGEEEEISPEMLQMLLAKLKEQE